MITDFANVINARLVRTYDTQIVSAWEKVVVLQNEPAPRPALVLARQALRTLYMQRDAIVSDIAHGRPPGSTGPDLAHPDELVRSAA